MPPLDRARLIRYVRGAEPRTDFLVSNAREFVPRRYKSRLEGGNGVTSDKKPDGRMLPNMCGIMELLKLLSTLNPLFDTRVTPCI